MKYRSDIDGLRAVAVILVVAFHVGIPGFAAGFIGVDVFFVISGFLISSLLFNEAELKGTIRISSFFARRVRRLFPAITFVIIIVLGIGSVLLHPFGQQQELAKSAVSALFFVSNIYFSETTGGYFDGPATEVPLLHFWSLSVEEQFYIVWPLAILLACRLASWRTLSFVRAVAAILVMMLVASFIYSLVISSNHDNSAYFSTPARAWQFLVGALLALGVRRINPVEILHPFGSALVVGLAGFSLLAISLLIISGPEGYPGWYAMLPTFGSALIILSGSWGGSSIFISCLSGRAAVYVGKLSFSWYLWHWPLISIVESYFLGEVSIYRNLCMASISLLLSVLTYEVVEKRFRILPISPKAVRRTLVFGAMATVFSVVVASGFGWSARHAETYQPWWPVDIAIKKARFSRPEYRVSCHFEPPFTGELFVDGCLLGDGGQPIRTLLWGDSHAGHLAPLFDRLGRDNEHSVLIRSFRACRPILGMYSYLPSRERDDCRIFHRAVFDELSELSQAGLRGVVLSGNWWGDFEELRISELGALQFRAEIKRTIQRIQSLGLKVLVIEPTPIFKFNPIGCLARRPAEACLMGRDEWDRKSDSVIDAIRMAVHRSDDADSLNLLDYLCDNKNCYTRIGRQILYRDNNHITPDAASQLTDLVSKQYLDFFRIE